MKHWGGVWQRMAHGEAVLWLLYSITVIGIVLLLLAAVGHPLATTVINVIVGGWK